MMRYFFLLLLFGWTFSSPVDARGPVLLSETDETAAGFQIKKPIQLPRGGWLGITVQDLTPQIAAQLGIPGEVGVFVTGVQFDSPAKKGGLMQGDVIISVGETKISSSEALRDEIVKTSPGTSVQLTIIRARVTRKIEISVGSPPREAV